MEQIKNNPESSSGNKQEVRENSLKKEDLKVVPQVDTTNPQVEEIKPNENAQNDEGIVMNGGLYFNTINLNEYFAIKKMDTSSEVMKTEIFKIKLPNNKACELISSVDDKLYLPKSYIDPHLNKCDNKDIAVKIGLNSIVASEVASFFRPGLVNCLPVFVSRKEYQMQDLYIEDKWEAPGTKALTLEQRASLGICYSIAYESQNFPAEAFPGHAYDADLNTLFSGSPLRPTYTEEGMTRNNQARILRGEAVPCMKEVESYKTLAGVDYFQLGTDKLSIRSFFTPMREAELNIANQNLKQIFVYLFNLAHKSNMCGSVFGEQLKLVLYSLMANTMSDCIENWNSHQTAQVIYSTTRQPEVYMINANPASAGCFGGHLAWCTFGQYVEIKNKLNNTEIHPQLSAFNWWYIPVKYNWTQDMKGKIFMANKVLRVCPYPVGGILKPTWVVAPIPDGFRGLEYPTWYEHLASHIELSGHINICFVLLDPPANIVLVPGNAGYFTGFRFDFGGANHYCADQLVFGPDVWGNHGSHDLASYYLGLCMNTSVKSEIKLLQHYYIDEDWQISASVFEFADFLTTMPVSQYYNSDFVVAGTPNIQLCNLLPFIPIEETGSHFTYPEMDFQQECFKILGLIKQKNTTYVAGLNGLVLSKISAGNRTALGLCLSELISARRNDVPVVINTYQMGEAYPSAWQNRRIEFVKYFEKEFLEHNEVLSDNMWHSSARGLMRYIIPWSQLPESYSANSGNDVVLRQMNEYCDVYDWYNFMTQYLEAKKSRRVEINDDIVKKFGTVQMKHNSEYLVAVLQKPNREAMDHINELFNDMWGRTLHDGRSAANQRIYYEAATKDATVTWNYMQPFYTVTQFTWQADMDEEVPQWSYSTLANLNLTCSFPRIRMLDYVATCVHRTLDIPLTVLWHSSMVNEYLDYIVTGRWSNEMLVPRENYKNVPQFEELH